MSITYPNNPDEVAQKIKTDVQNELPDSDPFSIRASFLLAIIIGLAGRVFDVYTTIKKLQDQLFPDTATNVFLTRWASFKGITRNPASIADGNVTATGTNGTAIPIGTTFQSTAGKQYITLQDELISTHNISVSSIARSGQIATVTTASNHNYATGISQTISGANETEYNITAEIIVTGENTFTYQVVGTPATPATGTILSTATTANVEVESLETGEETNLDSGAQLTFTTIIPGADQNVYVQFLGITGGTDSETDDDFRVRIIDAYQNPVSFFNVASLVQQAKLVTGVTRVFVQEITPGIGQTTVYFTRDNDDNIIPDGNEVNQVRAKLLEIKPGHMQDDDLKTPPLIGKSIDFHFTSLDPNTDAMKAAILANLTQFFREQTIVGETIEQDAYRSIIWQTIDSSGARIKSFSLSTPSGNIPVDLDEIGILGSISY